MLIDSHFHIFTSDTPLKSDLWQHRELPAPVEDMIANFAQFDVEKGVLATSSQYGLHRDIFVEAMRVHPQLRATVNLSLDTQPSEITTLSELGFLGTRLLWRKLEKTPDPDGADYQRLFRMCADAGWHVHIAEAPERMERTIRAIEKAGARVIVDHMGMVDTPDGINDPGFRAILEAIERGNTWSKLAGGFRVKQADPDRAAAALIAAGGWERLIWGSDWPFVGYRDSFTYAEAVKSLEHWVPDLEMRRRIGHDTANAFYFNS